jgi:hypothetical protein
MWRIHSSENCGCDIVICRCDIVICGCDIVICGCYIVVCGCYIVIFGFNIVICGYDIVVCGCDIVICGCDIMVYAAMDSEDGGNVLLWDISAHIPTNLPIFLNNYQLTSVPMYLPE